MQILNENCEAGAGCAVFVAIWKEENGDYICTKHWLSTALNLITQLHFMICIGFIMQCDVWIGKCGFFFISYRKIKHKLKYQYDKSNNDSDDDIPFAQCASSFQRIDF